MRLERPPPPRRDTKEKNNIVISLQKDERNGAEGWAPNLRRRISQQDRLAAGTQTQLEVLCNVTGRVALTTATIRNEVLCANPERTVS